MVVELNSFIGIKKVGTKGTSLIDLNRYGFKVPKSIALDTDEYKKIIKQINDSINVLIKKLTFDNIDEISDKIFKLFDQVIVDSKTLKQITNLIDEESIIRISLDNNFEYSFAGIFKVQDNVTKNNIADSIIKSYRSIFSYNSLYYMLKNKIDYKELEVALIIQKKLSSVFVGNCLTLNPVTLNDHELVININQNKENEQYYYDWQNDNFIFEDKYNLIKKQCLNQIIASVKKIQSHFEYPIEIEFALVNNELFFLQVKKIYNILYDNKTSLWNKQATNLKKLVADLHTFNYDEVIIDINKDFKINTRTENSLILFNTIYTNLLNINKVMTKLGSQNYAFNLYNKKTKNFFIKLNCCRKYKSLTNNFLLNFEDFHHKFNSSYINYCHLMTKTNPTTIEKEWLKLIFKDFSDVYKTITKLKLLNFIGKNLIYNELHQYISFEDFEILLDVGVKNKKEQNKLLLQKLVQKIKKDDDSYHYWFSTSVRKILQDYEKEVTEFYHPEFRDYINNYGYLSFHSIDITEPFYVEDVEEVIYYVKKLLASDIKLKEDSPKQKLVWKQLNKKLSSKKLDKLKEKIFFWHQLIIKQTILEDDYLKYLFLIKRYTKMLANSYLKKKIISEENDIWYLSIYDIYNFIDGEIDSDALTELINKNKIYYKAYYCFDSPNLIGHQEEEKLKVSYKGIGLSNKIVKGQIRMIKNLDELNTLTEKDILVTKTLSVSLLFKLPPLKGIIISNNYLDKNVQTLLREFNIPCLLLSNCSQKLKDKMKVKMDTSLGIVETIKR